MTHYATCSECCAPWGAIGDTVTRADVINFFTEWWTDLWYGCGIKPDYAPARPPAIPQNLDTSIIGVAWISESNGRWLSEHFNVELPSTPSWICVDELPAWWARTRTKRAIILSHCYCSNMPGPLELWLARNRKMVRGIRTIRREIDPNENTLTILSTDVRDTKLLAVDTNTVFTFTHQVTIK